MYTKTLEAVADEPVELACTQLKDKSDDLDTPTSPGKGALPKLTRLPESTRALELVALLRSSVLEFDSPQIRRPELNAMGSVTKQAI
jgi:hypothetical protein